MAPKKNAPWDFDVDGVNCRAYPQPKGTPKIHVGVGSGLPKDIWGQFKPFRLDETKGAPTKEDQVRQHEDWQALQSARQMFLQQTADSASGGDAADSALGGAATASGTTPGGEVPGGEVPGGEVSGDETPGADANGRDSGGAMDEPSCAAA